MTVNRWEKERSGWVLARAGHSLSARRRGEKLAATARRHERYGAGSDDAVQTEVTTHGLFYRITFREEGGMNTLGWFIAACSGATALVLAAGPAAVIGYVAYGVWWLMVPKWGRLFAGPYLGLAAVMAGLSWLIVSRLGLYGFGGFMAEYAAVQLVLGLAIAAWLTRLWGWPAVARKVKQSQGSVKPIHIEIPVDDEKDWQPVVRKEAPSPDIAPIEIEIDIPDEDTSCSTS